jgi:hypothetical protein
MEGRPMRQCGVWAGLLLALAGVGVGTALVHRAAGPVLAESGSSAAAHALFGALTALAGLAGALPGLAAAVAFSLGGRPRKEG